MGETPAKQEKKYRRNNTTWEPGRSGNPKGRAPAGETMAEVTRYFLEGIDPKRKKERRLALIEEAYNRAMSGEKKADKWADFLVNRGYGKAIESVKVEAEVSIKQMSDDDLSKAISEKEKALGIKNKNDM